MATSRFHENNAVMMMDSPLLRRIQTRALRNHEEVVNFVNQELPEMMLASPPKLQIQLIVLDSIAGMFRTCNEEGYPFNELDSCLTLHLNSNESVMCIKFPYSS